MIDLRDPRIVETFGSSNLARPRRGAGTRRRRDATAGGRAESPDGLSPHRGSDSSRYAAGTFLRLSGLDDILEQLQEWEADGGCEATDGCWVEPDGHCEHGEPSWMVALDLL